MILRPDAIFTGAELLEGHGVEILDGKIAQILTPGAAVGEIALPGRVVMPGLVDAHSHAFQRAFRGRVQHRAAGQDDFWTWRDAMYRVANALDPDGIEAVSRLAFLELALAGVTTIGEFHYLQHAPDGARYADPDELARRVIAAALDVGIRIVLLRVAYARHSPGKPLQLDQRRFGDTSPDHVLAAIQRLRAIADPRVRIGLAPHSVRAVPADWLPAFQSFDGPIHAHVSEQPGENAACAAEHHKSPLAVFADAGLVDQRFAAVHLTWPLPGDIERIRSAGASIVYCPSTELDLGDGFLPVDARDLPIAVGSDSHAQADPLAEARMLEMHARALAGRRNVLDPAPHGLATRLLRAATLDGDRALGGSGQPLRPGSPADLVAIDLRRPAAHGVPPLAAIAFNARPEWVTDTWVAGQPVVVDGRHPHQERILAAALRYLI